MEQHLHVETSSLEALLLLLLLSLLLPPLLLLLLLLLLLKLFLLSLPLNLLLNETEQAVCVQWRTLYKKPKQALYSGSL